MSQFPALDLIDEAGHAGFRLTAAGRHALATHTVEDFAAMRRALDEGTRFDQFATSEWDGEPYFEAETP